MPFVRNELSLGDDTSTRQDVGDVGTGRGCRRMVDIGSFGVGGPGMTQPKGLRTLKSPGVPASAPFAAFVAQRAVSVIMLPSGNTETEESRHVYRISGTAVWLRVRVQACVGNTVQKQTHT